MRKIGAFVGLMAAIWLAGPAQATPTVTDITGSLSKAENTCVSPIALFTSNPPQSCNYSGGEDVSILVGLGFVRNWMGPLDSGGFYATGTAPDPLTTTGSTPGDGKVNLPITGTITIENANTPGNGGDDSISGTLIIGAGERVVSTNAGSAVEGFTSVTHTIPVKVVSSAVGPNAAGGYDYVIGSAGYPTLHQSGPGGDSYPSEVASEATGSSSPPDRNVWEQANGGNVPVVNPFPGPPPPFAAGPYTVEIVTYAPVTGNVGPNIGVATTAVVAGQTCVAGDGAGSPVPTECDPDPGIGAGSTWAVSGAEFDNLILKVSTNANNKVVSAEAFYTLEYKIPSLFANGPTNPGSFIGGTLEFSGIAEAVDDSATTAQDTAVDIDILANDSLFSDPVTITLPGGGASANAGTVTINGTNPGPQGGIDVTYDPPNSFGGNDTFDYTINDGTNSGTATVSITVTGGGGGDIFPIAPDVGINTGEGQAVDIVISALPGISLGNMPVTISVVSGPASGTATVFGQIVTYSPTDFPSADSFDYTIEDVDGDTSTGTISIAIGPPLVPTAANDAVTVKQDASVNIPVKANDSPGSGAIGVHTVAITSEPVSGTAVVETDNTVTYTPDPGVAGTHTFEYTLTDVNQDTSAAAIVTITVEKTAVVISLPSGGSSAIGPWSLGFLVAVAWLHRRRGLKNCG